MHLYLSSVDLSDFVCKAAVEHQQSALQQCLQELYVAPLKYKEIL